MKENKSTYQPQNMEKRKGTTYSHILKYTGLFGGVQVFTILMSIIRNKFIAILIGAKGLGLVDIYNRTIEFVGNMTNFGISFSSIRHISELYEDRPEELRNYIKVVRSWGVLSSLLGMLFCIISSPLLSYISFNSLEQTFSFMILSPMVPMLTLIGVELAILKGIRKLKRLAAITAVTSLSTIFIAIPIYWSAGIKGVVAVLLLGTAVVLLLTMNATLRIYKWNANPFSPIVLKPGLKMIKLGISFILAGVLGSGSQMAIRSFMCQIGSLKEVGLYAAGLTITIAYSRMVFVAIDSDYFPRLSATMKEHDYFNLTVNRQIEVCVLLMTPILILFVFFLPIIIRILYTEEFLSIVPMLLCATLYMFFKAISTPIAYLSLANGDSFIYFIVEMIYDIFFVGSFCLAFYYYGIVGAGMSLSIANAFNLVLVFCAYHKIYGYNMQQFTLKISSVQFILILCSILIAWKTSILIQIIAGTLLFIISSYISIHILNREAQLQERLRSFIRVKLLHKNKKHQK